MSNKTLENLERDNSINKSKIESLQKIDGIMNEQLKLLTKNVLEISNIKQTVDSLSSWSAQLQQSPGVAQPISFAQTISWMPSDTISSNLSSPDGMNVNLKGSTYNSIAKLHDIATQDDQWFRLDLWSTSTNGNTYTNSNETVYEVLRHGFRVNKAGYFKLNCTLHLKPFQTNRYNIGMRFGKKLAADAHVDSTISSSTGGIIRPSADSANFTLTGVPVASGYVNLHSSGTKANESKHIDHILYLDVGDEVALFTTGFGVYGPNTELFAVTEYCSFKIQSM